MTGTRLSTRPTLPPITQLCRRCMQDVIKTEAVVIHDLSKPHHEVLSPRDMVAVEAFEKGLNFHMKDGRTVYELCVLKDILAQYPGIFFRAGRGWLVANDQIAGFNYAGPGKHNLILKHSSLVVPVTRRMWPDVAARLGVGLRGPSASKPAGAYTVKQRRNLPQFREMSS